MNIALSGPQKQKEEWKGKTGSYGNILEFEPGQDIPACDLLVDLAFDEHPEFILAYQHLGVPLVLSAVKIQLAAVVHHYGAELHAPLIGINALPGFLSKELAEVSLFQPEMKETATLLLEKTGLRPEWVEDRVGMVSPRILCMIINEAYYTVQEGTAGKADIDTGMKLGTAYPYGPFEWVDLLGIREVYEILDALYLDTREERYKICPLLKTEYLRKRN